MYMIANESISYYSHASATGSSVVVLVFNFSGILETNYTRNGDFFFKTLLISL